MAGEAHANGGPAASGGAARRTGEGAGSRRGTGPGAHDGTGTPAFAGRSEARSGETPPVKADSGQPSAGGQPGGPGQRSAETPRSRRFPRVTQDTARPEGGGRAASGDAPAPARQWPLLSVLGGTAVGLVVVAADAVRIGTIIIGLALIAAAVMRRVLPSVGMLAVRSRFTDMVTYGALGVVIVLLAMMAQPNPWLEIPWLKDVVHFTVR
ncbi:DUF3017 domain-containing protein [Streptomyces sp. KR80]|uniref:DUF3017 domain-containing protein n=1 Tax=Streptomyces sp. KR80 TaxID=3457426 RepID=UPI003FD0D0A8